MLEKIFWYFKNSASFFMQKIIVIFIIRCDKIRKQRNAYKIYKTCKTCKNQL